VYVGGDNANTTFTMSGGEISENIGRGVSVAGGTFTISGGTISGNTSTSDGGGVYVTGGTFTISGGEITKNTSISSGGGVYVYPLQGGTFRKTGGTITGYASDTVKGNVVKDSGVVQSNRGHAVYVSSTYVRRETTAGPTVNLDSSVSGSAGDESENRNNEELGKNSIN